MESEPRPASSSRPLFRVPAVLLGLVVIVGLGVLRVFILDSSHETTRTILPGRTKDLIPPTATEITLQRDLLDHYALYTVTEEDLNAFLDERFSWEGSSIRSFEDRSPVRSDRVGTVIGRLDWLVTEPTVVYSYADRNGAVSTYYHDPTTGRTYQASAHW